MRLDSGRGRAESEIHETGLLPGSVPLAYPGLPPTDSSDDASDAYASQPKERSSVEPKPAAKDVLTDHHTTRRMLMSSTGEKIGGSDRGSNSTRYGNASLPLKAGSGASSDSKYVPSNQEESSSSQLSQEDIEIESSGDFEIDERPTRSTALENTSSTTKKRRTRSATSSTLSHFTAHQADGYPKPVPAVSDGDGEDPTEDVAGEDVVDTISDGVSAANVGDVEKHKDQKIVVEIQEQADLCAGGKVRVWIGSSSWISAAFPRCNADFVLRKPGSRSLIFNFRRHFSSRRSVRQKTSELSPSVAPFLTRGGPAVVTRRTPCLGITSDAIRLHCSLSTKSYGGCTKREALVQELFGHTRYSEVIKDSDSLWRFKEREMETVQWRLVSPFVFSAKCKGVVATLSPCSERIKLRSNAGFRTALQLNRNKKRKLDEGETSATNYKYIPKSHFTCMPGTMIVLKHAEAFQSLIAAIPGFVRLAGGGYVQDGSEPSMGFWAAFSKAVGEWASANKTVFCDLCNVMLHIFNRDAKGKGMTNMKYSEVLDDFVATLSCFNPQCSENFVRTLSTRCATMEKCDSKMHHSSC